MPRIDCTAVTMRALLEPFVCMNFQVRTQSQPWSKCVVRLYYKGRTKNLLSLLLLSQFPSQFFPGSHIPITREPPLRPIIPNTQYSRLTPIHHTIGTTYIYNKVPTTKTTRCNKIDNFTTKIHINKKN